MEVSGAISLVGPLLSAFGSGVGNVDRRVDVMR
jgi:hypothetical protein